MRLWELINLKPFLWLAWHVIFDWNKIMCLKIVLKPAREEAVIVFWVVDGTFCFVFVPGRTRN